MVNDNICKIGDFGFAKYLGNDNKVRPVPGERVDKMRDAFDDGARSAVPRTRLPDVQREVRHLVAGRGPARARLRLPPLRLRPAQALCNAV